MCGIFAIINSNYSHEITNDMIEDAFQKGKNRGPEFSKLSLSENLILGFHRLAINGLNEQSNQPLIFNEIELICNGEIYNHVSLYESMKITPNTGSDCEVILHLYLKYGIEQTLTMLDGVFSFILNDKKRNVMFVARDPYGVRPLYSFDTSTNNYSVIAFASELKMIEPFYNLYTSKETNAKQFTPGSFSMLKYNHTLWEYVFQNKYYFIPGFSNSLINNFNITEITKQSFSKISHELKSAVFKRCISTERRVACLLSGGLDSSLIAALVAEYFNLKGLQIETYSIGLANSEDIKYAKIVANHIGSKHTEIIVTEDIMFNAIPEVIQAIESYDTTTVRASIGNFLIGKYIAANSQAKVIFNGDGSDELFGGYLYMNKCPDDIEFDIETRRLLKEIHTFDVLRSDKCISSNGLEPRTPFLDRNFVNAVLSIPPYLRNHNNFHEQEKYLLRFCFSADFYNKKLLPDEILWRRKEAFSDGVSSQGKSLFSILQEKITLYYQKNKIEKLQPCIELEKKFYKEIFDREFPNLSHILPHFWMPKYVDAIDPSARTLDIYD